MTTAAVMYVFHDPVSGEIKLRSLMPPNDAPRLANDLGLAWIEDDSTVVDGYVADGLKVAFPPRPSAHHEWNWTSRAWMDERTPEDRRRALRAQVAERRWALETGGLVLPDGLRVSTKRSDRDALTALLVKAERAGIEAVDFKFDSGWARMSLAELDAVARAIELHVQACFSSERSHHEAIAMLETVAQFDAYDCNAGWPGTGLSVSTSEESSANS